MLAESVRNPESQQFVEAFLSVHRPLYAYVVTLTPTLDDAEEVFQKTSLVLWKRWSDFDPDRKFLPWAFGIARIQARSHLSRSGRAPLSLGQEAEELVANAMIESSSAIDSRAEILQKCLQKLPRSQQALLKRCYVESGRSIQQVADEQKVTANSIYQKLKRLRETLHACVDRHLASGGAT